MANRGELFERLLDHRKADLDVGHFPAAELQAHLHLVPLVQEPLGMDELGHQIVGIDASGKLDLLDLGRAALGRFRLLVLLVDVLAEIEDTADRRSGVGRHLDEVETDLLGKLVGIFVIAALQFALIIVLTRVLYNVNWGESVPAVIVMAVATVLAGAGLSTLVAAFARTPEQAGEVGPAVALIYSLLGGSMWSVYNMPAWMNSLSRLTFMRWSIEGFTSLMVKGGGVASILRPVGVCLAMAAVFLFISVTILNREYR